MVFQAEHRAPHYTSYCQRRGKVSQIATTALLHFMEQELYAAMGENTEYQNASRYKWQKFIHYDESR